MTTQARPWKPTSEQATRLLAFRRSGEHYGKNTSQIRKEYAGKFIAISDGNIIATKDEAKDLLQELRAQFSEASLSQIYITYVPREQEARIA